jgi:curved DNA-binding protein CbpA
MDEEFTIEPSRKSREDIYEMLELPRYAKLETVKDAVHTRIKELKPKADSLDDVALEEFSRISNQFSQMSTEEKKQRYDVYLAFSDPEIKIIMDEAYSKTPIGHGIQFLIAKSRLDHSIYFTHLLQREQETKNVEEEFKGMLFIRDGEYRLVLKEPNY